MINWNKKRLEKLTELYKTHTARECSEIMGISYTKVRGALCKFRISAGTKRFGSVPKGTHTSPGSEFKNGNTPANFAAIGTMRKRNTAASGLRWFIKTETGWKPYQRWWWETNIGPVEPDYSVVLKDNDGNNLNPENFAKVSRAELVQMNKNIDKTAEKLKEIYKRERVRKAYGLPAISGYYERIVNY